MKVESRHETRAAQTGPAPCRCVSGALGARPGPRGARARERGRGCGAGAACRQLRSGVCAACCPFSVGLTERPIAGPFPRLTGCALTPQSTLTAESASPSCTLPATTPWATRAAPSGGAPCRAWRRSIPKRRELYDSPYWFQQMEPSILSCTGSQKEVLCLPCQ